MTAAGVAFTIMVVLVKFARVEHSAFEIVYWRGILSLPVLLVVAARVGLRIHAARLFAARAVLGFGAMVGFTHAAAGLAVANLSLIHKMQPILVGMAAPIFLGAGERAGRLVWLILGLGLGGTALIVGPDLAVGSTYGLVAFGAAVLSAGSHVCIRGLARTDDARVIVLWFHGAIAAMAAVYIVASTGALPVLPAVAMWPYLIGIAASATVGQLLITQAYAEDRAPVVAAAAYTTPVWGLLADLVVFADPPAASAIAGGSVIVVAGLVLILRKMPHHEDRLAAAELD